MRPATLAVGLVGAVSLASSSQAASDPALLAEIVRLEAAVTPPRSAPPVDEYARYYVVSRQRGGLKIHGEWYSGQLLQQLKTSPGIYIVGKSRLPGLIVTHSGCDRIEVAAEPGKPLDGACDAAGPPIPPPPPPPAPNG